MNSNILPNSSQEFIAETMMHEIYHSYLNANSGTKNELKQHLAMAETYVSQSTAAPRGIFPSLPEQEAKAMILAGFSGIQLQKPAYWNELLAKNHVTENDVFTAKHANVLQSTFTRTRIDSH